MSAPPPAPPEEAAVVADPRRRRLILLAMCVALVAVVASVSGLNVAQQAMAEDLGASQSTLLWIINGYTIALASLLLPLGAVGDRWGRKRLLVGGLVVFVGANLVAALAGSTDVLLAARVAAGVGAAMVMPITLSVITSSFPAAEKPRAVALWAGFSGAGAIIGLFASSAIVDLATWPWVFALPVVMGVAALALSVVAVPDSREVGHARFDLGGSILSAVAIGGLVLGIHEGPEQGWADPLTLAGLVAGGLALVGFVAWEARHPAPLLDVRLFRHRGLAAGSVSLLVGFGTMFGMFLVLIQFLQAVAGLSALAAAAGLLPVAITMMALSNAAPRVVERLGMRSTLLAGLGLFAGGLGLMGVMGSADGGYLSVAPGLVVVAMGLALTTTPATTAITDALPADKQGVASALNDTVRELGGALGVALLGSVLNSSYGASVAPAADALPPELAEATREGIGGALGVAATLGPDGAGVATAARQAFMDGWQTSMFVGVALASVAFTYVLVRGPRPEAVPAEAVGEEVPVLVDA